MEIELNILKYEDIKQDITVFFKRKSLIPIVGAGISCGARAYNGAIPTGTEYMKHMLAELKANNSFNDDEQAELQRATFSTLCDYYEDDAHISPNKRFSYLKNNFFQTSLDESDVRQRFFQIDWPYIYSLNIDDAIEHSSDYKTIILPNREYRDEVFAENRCLVKLHGDIGEIVKYKDGGKIFTSKEYALSLEQNELLLNKLRNDYSNQNILFIGCSLDDEIDLKTLSSFPVSFTAKDSLRKTILFMKGVPSKLQKSRYKTYGITDVVSFDDYDYMYKALLDAWEESQNIDESTMESYESITIHEVKSLDKDLNHDYFFWGKSLLDAKNSRISFPYYFISRAKSSDIINALPQNKIHLISGSNMSGKSYLLAGLYQEIRDRRVCFFDGKSRLSSTAMSKLLSYNNSVILLDNGALTREQFELILENAKAIHKNGSNFIICVNDSDSDTNGLIKYKIENGLINDADIMHHKIDKKFKNTNVVLEIDKINQLFPAINLPPYSDKRTILDQHIYAEKELGVKSKFTNIRIKIANYKQLALLLVLAIKEKISSLDVTNLALDMEIAEAVKKYNPFIERVETFTYEKDGSDLSSLKYVLNSKYWLRRELGRYAQNEDNYAIIGDAYQYIIRKVKAAAGSSEFKKRKLCKNYIMFDIMNSIFLNGYGGSIKLIVSIYDKLHEQLATDYNFLHQNAKCLLNYFYTLKESKEKSTYLFKALELAIISKTMVEHLLEDYQNETLLISVAHIQFTIASIQSNLCKLHTYSDFAEIEITIDAVDKALESPYNVDYQQGQRSSNSIIAFIKKIYSMLNLDLLHISTASSKKAREMMSYISFGGYSKKK